jgi:1-acyl-sn-glycerol-3-phosphate acyltransferase
MRVTTGEIGHFNKGSFHLATSLHAQIVPIYFAIPREINPGMGYEAKPGLIDVYFLPPIDTSRWVLADLERNRDAVRDLFVRVHDSMQSTGRLPESLTIESRAPLHAEAFV